MRTSGGFEVADIFRQHGTAYRSSHRLPRNHLRVMHAIELCRTSVLGGHKDKCDNCGHLEISYNSCRNRHCPKCQTLAKEKWIEARSDDLLPIEYFHVVFTIPSELNPLVSLNRKVMYDLLFRSVSETLVKLSNDPKHLGARIGAICILHTWGQSLMDHPHIHCIVTGGGLSSDGNRWVSCRKGFFLPVRVLSTLFSGKFLDYLKHCFKNGVLVFDGTIRHLKVPGNFNLFRKQLHEKKWVVYCQKPFCNNEKLINYPGNYTHRVAISNNRIMNHQSDKVSFSYKDYKTAGIRKQISINADEFIRRFLQHVLPLNFYKIRYFGFMSMCNIKSKLANCFELIDRVSFLPSLQGLNALEVCCKILGKDLFSCPKCKSGKLKSHIIPITYNLKPG